MVISEWLNLVKTSSFGVLRCTSTKESRTKIIKKIRKRAHQVDSTRKYINGEGVRENCSVSKLIININNDSFFILTLQGGQWRGDFKPFRLKGTGTLVTSGTCCPLILQDITVSDLILGRGTGKFPDLNCWIHPHSPGQKKKFPGLRGEYTYIYNLNIFTNYQIQFIAIPYSSHQTKE